MDCFLLKKVKEEFNSGVYDYFFLFIPLFSPSQHSRNFPLCSKGSPKESPQKSSVRPTRQLKINPVGQNSPSPSTLAATRTPKDGSPKIAERKSPRSPLPEKKRPSKLSELESQVSKLHDDLKKVKDQLIVSESSKKEAQADAEEVKRQLAELSLKLEESQKQVYDLIDFKEASVLELENISQEKDQKWESQLESAHKQQSADSAALASAHDEIQRLKQQLETIAESQDEQGKQRESTNAELISLKENLAETVSLVENMKHELKGSRESEAQAQELVRETLHQLEAAKETVNALRSDVCKSTEAYNAITSELEQSRARACFLEDLVSKLNADLMKAKESARLNPTGDQKHREHASTISEIVDVNELELEFQRTKCEIVQLKSSLQAAERRYDEQRSHSSSQIKKTFEQLEQIKAETSLKEAQLEAEVKKARANIEELKANLMDKETELQCISEENESLNKKLERSMSCQREQELENELKNSRDHVEEMKANLTEKLMELQKISEENGKLKMEMESREMEKNVDETNEVEASRAAEQDAMAKLGCMMEEVDKSNRKAARAAEQLEAAQAANAEMEAELRKLKVQSDQWRKAAEAAASMLSPGTNGKYVERTGSLPLDNNYSPIGGRLNSPYLDDYDEDSYKKKNGSVLKKIGVLWKKPQK